MHVAAAETLGFQVFNIEVFGQPTSLISKLSQNTSVEEGDVVA